MEQNKEPRNGMHRYRQLMFDKGAKIIQWRNESIIKNCSVKRKNSKYRLYILKNNSKL